MKSKRLLSTFLSAVMLVSVLFSCLSVELFATDQVNDGAAGDALVGQQEIVLTAEQLAEAPTYTAQIPFTPNPLYEDVIGNIAPQLDSSESIGDSTQPLNSTYVSPEQAGESMRWNLRNRISNITVNVYSTNSDYNAVALQVVAFAMQHTGVSTEGDYLLWHYLGYQGGADWKIVNGTYHYTFSFDFSYYTTKTQEDVLTVAVDKLKKELNLDGATDYEKVKAVYDYICQNIEYDYDNLDNDSYTLKHTAYSALVNKKTVCQGYATLFYRLMLELGIDCRVIAGTGGGGAHGWNIVELDGLYYNLDTTWDAPNGAAGWPYEYFLKCDAKFFGHYPYDEYETEYFIAAYPKGARDYLDTLKPEFEIVDGVLVSYNGIGGDVVIPDGVTAIGDYAFYGCTTVTSVKMPETVESIGEGAFCDCENITDIEMPESLKYIGDGAFMYCYDLISIELPDGLETIGMDAFYDCLSLKNITIPSSVTSISNYAFDESGLTSITFLSKNTDIYDSSMTIPTSTEIHGYIGSTAEAYATKYSRTFIPLTTADLGSGTCGDGLEWVVDVYGNLTISGEGDMSEAPWSNLADEIKTITVGEGVTSITEDAFADCTNATTLTFENDETVIPDSASTIPSGVVINGGTDSTAQKYAEKYGRVYIDVNEKDIASGTCGDNLTWRLTANGTLIVSGRGEMRNNPGWGGYKNQIKSVMIENGVTTVIGYAFQDCENLTSVSLPDTLTAIWSYAFSDCTALASVTIPGSVKEIPYYAFASCSGLTEVILEEGIEKIEYLAFSGCSSIKEIVLPASLKELDNMAFLYANSMKKVTFLNPDTVIEDSSSTIPSTATIYGYDGSTAQAYAEKHSRKFIDLEGRTGDLDGDGSVTRNDAIYLLYNSLFPEDYPISEDCDYDADGNITRNDAIYLLYYSLFPEDYPLQ